MSIPKLHVQGSASSSHKFVYKCTVLIFDYLLVVMNDCRRGVYQTRNISVRHFLKSELGVLVASHMLQWFRMVNSFISTDESFSGAVLLISHCNLRSVLQMNPKNMISC